VINTNLPPILHRFQVMVKFSLTRGECLTLTLSVAVIPCQYRRGISLKTRFFGLHFCQGEYWCIFNHFYVSRSESYRLGLVKVIQILIGVFLPVESSYATSY